MKKYDIDKINRDLSLRELIKRESGIDAVDAGNKQTKVCCPLHDEDTPSFFIDKDDNGFKCFGCGAGGDIIKFIMLYRNLDFISAAEYLNDTYNLDALIDSESGGEKKSNAGRKPKPILPIPQDKLDTLIEKITLKWWREKIGEYKMHWVYRSAKGEPMYFDVRFETFTNGKLHKKVLPIHYTKAGFKQGIPFDALNQSRILFNLDQIYSDQTKPILIVEGCKCASVDYQGLRDRFILTTWPGGTNGLAQVDLRPLQGRKLVIWPDRDNPNKNWQMGGYKAAYIIADKLKSLSEVTILKASGNPTGGNAKSGYDIYDYIEDGGDPLAYIDNPDNVISIEDCLALSGFIETKTETGDDYNSIRQFTDLNDPLVSQMYIVRASLERNQFGQVKKSDRNILSIITDDKNFARLVAYDSATNDIKFPDSYKELDQLYNKIWLYMQTHYDLPPDIRQRNDIIKTIAYRNIFNSIEVFLRDIEYQLFKGGEPVFEKHPLTLIMDHIQFGLEESYTNADEVDKYYFELFDKYFTRMFLKLEGIIRREFHLVIPADIVPILEGAQGIGKTRFCLFLSNDPKKFYVSMEELQLTTNRDTLSKIRGKLIGEIGELSSLKRSEVEGIKAFISVPYDEQRRLYSESTYKSPRTVSFIGTTNEPEYLRDTTGNRRFFPVRMISIDDSLFDNQELINRLYVFYWHKAKALINSGEYKKELVLSNGLIEFMNYLREEKRVKPVYLDAIMKYILDAEHNAMQSSPVRINLLEATSKLTGIQQGALNNTTKAFMNEFKRILQSRGYINVRRYDDEGKQKRYWELDGRVCEGCGKATKEFKSYYDGEAAKYYCPPCLENVSAPQVESDSGVDPF